MEQPTMDPFTIATAVLALISEVTPYLGTASLVVKIVDALEALIPVVTTNAKNLIPNVRDAISTLRGGNVAITPEQLSQLDAFEAQLDAAYDQSDAAATTEEQAATQKPAGS